MKGGLIALLATLALPVLAQDTRWRIGPPEDWVADVPYDAATTAAATGGVDYLLADTQYRISGPNLSRYSHYASKVLNQSGVTEVSQLQFPFDPAHQTLVLHDISVVRSGQATPRLHHEAVSVLRREEGLEYQIIDGTLTAHVVLDDVRVGDVVEYRFTVHGQNPVFGGRTYFSTYLQWSVPVRRAYLRILRDNDTPLRYRAFGDAREPTVRVVDGIREYVWDLENRPGLEWEEDTPAWYRPYAEIQVSDSRSWAEVLDWALPLYQVPPTDRAQCATLAQTLTDRLTEPGDKAAELLEYVQQEVRYTGLEIGPNSHAPNPPRLVLERRFGDCKDKSVLLVALLQAVGIEAYPALVNTDLRKHVEELLPSPLAFDHVIVMAQIDGRVFYLDPTMTFQGGLLDDTPSRYYGRTLVIREGALALAGIPEPPHTEPTTRVSEVFDATGGTDTPVSYAVETVYRASDADLFRARLAQTGLEQLQTDYLNYLERFYPGLSSVRPVEIRDDPLTNRLTVVETYLVPDMWTHDDEDEATQLTVHPYELYGHVDKPQRLRRTMPLALTYPLHLEHEIQVLLHEPWPVDNDDVSIQNAGFSYTSKARYTEKGTKLTLTFRLLTFKDSVAPGELQRYLADLERVEKDLAYTLTVGGKDTAQPRGAWAAILAAVGVVVLVAVVRWTGAGIRGGRPPA